LCTFFPDEYLIVFCFFFSKVKVIFPHLIERNLVEPLHSHFRDVSSLFRPLIMHCTNSAQLHNAEARAEGLEAKLKEQERLLRGDLARAEAQVPASFRDSKDAKFPVSDFTAKNFRTQ
jgi:hypothetical protein